MTYSRQLMSKQEILLDALKRIGKIDLSPDKVTVFPSLATELQEPDTTESECPIRCL